MMSIEAIRAESDKAARRAARDGRVPYVPFDEKEIVERRFKIPFIGSYGPKDWRLVETLFCDSSGFGAENEPALTRDAFIAKLVAWEREGKHYGYAITEAGQFQVYIGVFEKTAPPRGRR